MLVPVEFILISIFISSRKRFEGGNNVHSLTGVPVGERSSPKKTPELGVGALEDLYKLQVHVGQLAIQKKFKKIRTADGSSVSDKSGGSCLTKGRNSTKGGEGAVWDL